MTRRQALIETLKMTGLLVGATGLLVGCESGSGTGTGPGSATPTAEAKADEAKRQKATEEYLKEQQHKK
jgi:hypothetical protein